VLLSIKTSYNAAVKSFYAAKGIDFGVNPSDVIENTVLGVNSAMPHTFTSRSPTIYSQEDVLRGFLFTAPRSSSRSLPSIPDTCHAKTAAGKPRRDDNLLLLEESGLVKYVRYASCSESFRSSDGPSSPPLFEVIQIPPFHRLKTGRFFLLAFAGVKISFKLSVCWMEKRICRRCSYLRPGLHTSPSSIFGEELCVSESGFHFVFTLDRPRILNSSEFARRCKETTRVCL
jgi:hypothetical protein